MLLKADVTDSKLSCAVIFFAFVALSILGSGYSSADDVYIYMTYAKSIFLDGHGYSYNGVSSAGATSFLWLQVAGLFQHVVGGGVCAWKFLGAIFYGLSAVVLSAAFGFSALMLLAVMMDPMTLRWSSTGMENSLTLFFVVLLFSACGSDSKHRKWLFFMLPISLVVRPEIFMLNMMLCLFSVIQERHRLTVFLGYLALASALFLLARGFVDFPLLPQTARAKSIFLKQDDHFYASLTLLKIFGLSAILFSAAVLSGIKALSAERRALWIICLIYAFAVSAYLAISNSLVSTRYETSIFFPLILASALCISELRNRRLACLTVLLQLVVSASLFAYFSPTKFSDEGDAIRRFALESRDLVTGPDRRVVMSEVGAFGYYSGLQIVDLVGLVSPEAMAFYEKTHLFPGKVLEDFLIFCDAKYYVESFGAEVPIRGEKLIFTELLRSQVVRNNMARGGLKLDIWRLYRIERKPEE